MDNILYITLKEELDAGVLMAQEINCVTPKDIFSYKVDYENLKSFSVYDFIATLQLGMKLAKEGYSRIEVERCD